jgi:hypothetical protein
VRAHSELGNVSLADRDHAGIFEPLDKH